MKKKLSLFIYSLAGGGAERVMSLLLNELISDFDIVLVLMSDEIVYDIPENIKIYYLENSNPQEHGIKKLVKLPYLGWKYRYFLKRNNIDISLAFTNRPSYISIFAKLFGAHAKIVISERTTPSMIYKSHSLQSVVNRTLIQYLYPLADKIIANSLGNKQDLVDNFYIDTNLIDVIANPFDLDKIVSSTKKTQALKPHIFTYITAGRLIKSKNHKMLIDVFSKLPFDNVELLILGEGEEKERLNEYIKSIGLADKVKLIGFVSNPYTYFFQADVFVFASDFEGFPNVLVEALACNLPVISTDCESGPREILAPNSTKKIKRLSSERYGILIPLHDENAMLNAMQIMYRDDEIRKRYSRLAFSRATMFDKSKITQKFVDSLVELF